MTTEFLCWHCGGVLQNLILPLSRREECSNCSAEQHVCKMCKHFDADSSTQCTEERAEPPSNKEAANFCDYFMLGKVSVDSSTNHDNAMRQLNDLFGDVSAKSAEPVDEINIGLEDGGSPSEFDPEQELKKLFDN